MRTSTQAQPPAARHSGHMNALLQLKGTTAFFVQAILSFVVSITAVTLGIVYLPAPIWIRAFLALGMLYVTTSTFTLAKCVRDRQEAGAAAARREASGQVLPPNAPYVDPSAAAWS
ncbi:hypothetical protein GCM10022214_76340 [Actinomadura miaoliensis]|uniref:YiaAB two helix domain-containing protein n=2 Tax=Actinomadura miaoliensis TaxID=430685 RepID=A0ABP7X0S9_9ACTN